MNPKAWAARKRAASHEIVHAAAQLERKARRFAPATLAPLGKSAFSAITALPHVDWGANRTRSATLACGCCPT